MKYSDLEKAVGVLDHGKVTDLVHRYNEIEQVLAGADIKEGLSNAAFIQFLIASNKSYEGIVAKIEKAVPGNKLVAENVLDLVTRYNQLVDVKQVCVDAGIKTGVSYAAFVECLVNDSKELEQIKCLCNNNGAKPYQMPIDYISKVFDVNESYAKSIALLDDQLKELQSKYKAQEAAVSVWKGYEKRIEAVLGDNNTLAEATNFIELVNKLLPTDEPLVDRVRTLVNGADNGKISDLAQALDNIKFKYTCPIQGATELTNIIYQHRGVINVFDVVEFASNLSPAPAQYDYESIVKACVKYYNDKSSNSINTSTLLKSFKELVKYAFYAPSAPAPAPAPAPTTVLEAGSIMTMLAKHLNKPIGVSDIEPAIKELISTKPSNPKLIELVESFRTKRDILAPGSGSPVIRSALEAATDLCNEVTAMFNAAKMLSTSAIFEDEPCEIITPEADKNGYIIIKLDNEYMNVLDHSVARVQSLTLALMEQLDLPLETVQKLQLKFKVEAL